MLRGTGAGAGVMMGLAMNSGGGEVTESGVGLVPGWRAAVVAAEGGACCCKGICCAAGSGAGDASPPDMPFPCKAVAFAPVPPAEPALLPPGGAALLLVALPWSGCSACAPAQQKLLIHCGPALTDLRPSRSVTPSKLQLPTAAAVPKPSAAAAAAMMLPGASCRHVMPLNVTAVMPMRCVLRPASGVGSRPKVKPALPPAAVMLGLLVGLTTWLLEATAAGTGKAGYLSVSGSSTQ